MAYRRKQGITRSSTFQEERIFRTPGDPFSSSLSSNSSSLAAQAIRATAAHRDQSSQGAVSNGYASTANGNESAAGGGLWGVLAKKGKDILEDGNMISQHFGVPSSSSILKESQEGLLYQETSQNYVSGVRSPWQQTTRPQTQTTYHEDQLKASRDVAMATAAKAKLLLRELKTVKADLAFAKQRCSQLEEENKMLREAREKGDHPADDDMIRLQLETLLAEKARLAHENSVYAREKGDHPADDDMIRLQLETLLAEKARLAHENSVYARENLILREIVEYHQLTMQDVVYLDEGIEEVTEVSPIPAVSRMLSASPPLSPRTMHKSPSRNSLTMETTPSMHKSPSRNSLTKETTPPSSYTSTSKGKDLTRQ